MIITFGPDWPYEPAQVAAIALQPHRCSAAHQRKYLSFQSLAKYFNKFKNKREREREGKNGRLAGRTAAAKRAKEAEEASR